MKYFYTYLLIIGLFITCINCAIFSYPIFSATGSVTPNQQVQINDANEFESTATNSNSKTKVVSLNWYDVVDSILPKFTDIQIIDVITKTKFVVQRTGGYNHADIEPINKENTSKIYSIYGNTWSWKRRPVWVQVNGIWIAGSINGMPHGYSLIADNELDGHICLHFLESRTHGTKKIDKAHQNAIKYAISHSNEINKFI